MAKAGESVNSWLAACLDLLFPPRCPVCRQLMPAVGQWCPACLQRCRLAIVLRGEEHELHYLDEVTVFADYSGAVRQLLQSLKYRHEKAAAIYLQALLPATCVHSSTGVVPVPVHPERLRRRGYNQTSLIFQAWAEQQGLAWLDVLQRVKPTLPQYSLQRTERRDNIKGAFTVTRPELIYNQNILLVDDIFTSGITLDECAHVLRRAGAATVRGAVCASSSR